MVVLSQLIGISDMLLGASHTRTLRVTQLVGNLCKVDWTCSATMCRTPIFSGFNAGDLSSG